MRAIFLFLNSFFSLERGVLEPEPDVAQRGTADGVHCQLLGAARAVLGETVGGIDAGDRADPGVRLDQPAPACARPDLRCRQIAGRAAMYLEKFNLKGRTAVVTGGGQGIGFACAQALGRGWREGRGRRDAARARRSGGGAIEEARHRCQRR